LIGCFRTLYAPLFTSFVVVKKSLVFNIHIVPESSRKIRLKLSII